MQNTPGTEIETEAQIKKLEKRTFTLHLVSQVFNGITLGIVLLQDIILKKSLGGTDFQVMVIALLLNSAFLVSIYGSEIVNRSRNRPKTIIITGFASKIFFIVLPLINSPIFYILCIAANAYLDSLLLSTWNIVFKHNYTERNRSRLYSYATTLQVIILLLVSIVFGYFLDLNQNIYRLFFPIAGLFGMVTYYNLAKMISLSADYYKGQDKIAKTKYSWKLVKDIIILPARYLTKIFSDNKAFLKFEIYFFLYGMAFMVLTPAIPVFLVDGLHLGYTPISFAKGLVFNSALILFTPLMGKHHGTGNPEKFSGYMFLILTLFPLLLVFSKYAPSISTSFNSEYILYISYFIFGIAMSGVTIAWSLSSIYFAPPAQVSNYQAAHITLTGIRGIFSPVLGYGVMKLFGIEYTFYMSAFLFFLGGILMYREGKKKILKTEIS